MNTKSRREPPSTDGAGSDATARLSSKVRDASKTCVSPSSSASQLLSEDERARGKALPRGLQRDWDARAALETEIRTLVLQQRALQFDDASLDAKLANARASLADFDSAPARPRDEQVPSLKPIGSGLLASCFAGLGLSEEQLRKAFSDRAKWLGDPVQRGSPGKGRESLWNPVAVAHALHRKSASTNKPLRVAQITARFEKHEALRSHLPAWLKRVDSFVSE